MANETFPWGWELLKALGITALVIVFGMTCGALYAILTQWPMHLDRLREWWQKKAQSRMDKSESIERPQPAQTSEPTPWLVLSVRHRDSQRHDSMLQRVK